MRPTKAMLFISGIFVLYACGTGLRTPGTIKLCDDTLTFDKDISAMVSASGTARCGSCHAGKYDNKDGIQNNRKSVYSKVLDGSMPQGSSGFKDSADGKTFLAWSACPTLN